ncbi:hypothetical protein HDV00_001001 [Rhizophlyctis rosea]|nr:hypothetical protein HDV00_001001 [Rhizophlyctis rosea]
MAYVPEKVAKTKLAVHGNTLRGWARSGKIEHVRTPGGKRLYNIDKFEQKSLQPATMESRAGPKPFAYCRVSSANQRDDLERQVSFMQEKYPGHEVITDIASGLNFKRRGLQTLLDLSFRGLVSEIAIAHKDRLCRFSFDLLEWIFKQHSVKLVVLNPASGDPTDDLSTDLLSVVHVFSCRINGRRKYRKKVKEVPRGKGGNGSEKDPTTYNLALEMVKEGKFKPLEFDRLRWRAGAVRELCDTYESNFKKKKLEPKHVFDISFRRKRGPQSISLQKDSFVKQKKPGKPWLFPSFLKDDIEASPHIEHDALLT